MQEQERDRVAAYFLLAEAVARLTLPDDDSVKELLMAGCEELGRRAQGFDFANKLMVLIEFAYRYGAAAAFMVKDENEEGLQEVFHQLLDAPEGGNNGKV